MPLSQESERIIKEFLAAWWADLTWKAHETVAGAELCTAGQRYPGTPDLLYDQLLGHQLRQLAAAAEGLLPNDQDTRAETYEACQQLCEWMWARPGMPATYHIPREWWQSPMGAITLRAYVWAANDEWISIAEAARLSGRSYSGIANLIEQGALTCWTDPSKPNKAPGRRQVRRSEVERLPPQRKHAP